MIDFKIPKRIIQTNKSLDLAVVEKAAVANVRLLNADFEYMFFDDRQVEEFIDKEFPQYRDIYNSFPVRIQRYDFFRYLAIYRYGGFYLDMDVLLASGLSVLLDAGCVFPFEALTINTYLRDEHGMDWEVGNYAFGAAPGHPFVRAIIDNCIRAQENPSWVREMARSVPRLFRDDYSVLYTTGPLLVSRTLTEFPEASKYVTILFPEDVCDQRSWNYFGRLGVHLRTGSWRKERGLFRRLVQRSWEMAMLKKSLKESVKRGKQRALIFGPIE